MVLHHHHHHHHHYMAFAVEPTVLQKKHTPGANLGCPTKIARRKSSQQM